MRKPLLLLYSLVLAFALAVPGLAHPLGNFSVNQFSRIEVGPSLIKIHQVVDLAEIPTFQESSRIDTDRDGTISESELGVYQTGLTPDFLSKLVLNLNGEPTSLELTNTKASMVTGDGNLPTLRLEWDLAATRTSGSGEAKVQFRNNNYSERIGWREIIVNSTTGANVYNSSAFANTLSDNLRSYPQDLLSAPLAERTVEFSVTAGDIPANAAPLRGRDGSVATPVQRDRLAELISVPEITPMIALFGLLVAFGLGAVHAMSPGHGKTVVGAYLVGSKGTAKHAVFLGLTVTITHTLGVFAVGLIMLFASNYILPERVMPFLGFVSGLLVFFIGITLFKNRLFALLGWKTETAGHHHHDGQEHGHDHGHDHSHDHGDEAAHTHSHDGLTHTHGGSTHSHALPDDLTWRNLLALGISGGLLPCPSALVLMLAAITAGRTGYGLILTLAFSVGLAATLTIVGLIFLNARNLFGRTALSNNRVFKALPVFSAFVIASVGAVLCYNAIQ